eukprot:jgi/Mesen1/9881/ME000070S09162
MIWEYLALIVGILNFIFLVILPSFFLACCLCARDAIGNREKKYKDLSSIAVVGKLSADTEDYHMMNPNASYKLSKPILAAAAAARDAIVPRAYTLDAAAQADHLGGIPRKIALSTVGAFSTLLTSVFNKTEVVNKERLMELVNSRPPGTPLITVSNHMSTLDDPLMWGHWWLRSSDPKLCRWTLTAKDICFTNKYFSYLFRVGKSIPTIRGGGIQQDAIFEAIDRVNDGDWLHTFPEGKVQQEHLPISRMKWGVASIIARASNPPLVLCIGHSGFEKVMPEQHWFGRRALVPLWFKNISLVVGEPIQFDIPALRKKAEEAVSSGCTQFGADALIQPSEEVEKLEEPVYVEDGPKQDKSVLSKAEAIALAGDEATRRLYSEITRQLKDTLESLTFEAHKLCNERTRSK